jgi:hypothetical protein
MAVNLTSADSDSAFSAYDKYASQLAVEQALALYVRKKFEEAEQHRTETGISRRLNECLRAKKREYTAEELQMHGGIDVYVGICDLKSKGAESWITDILLSSIDKPFTLKPTPIPELPEWMKEQVVDMLEQELESLGGIENITGLMDKAKELKSISLKFAYAQAERAAAAMEKHIEDQLLEGGWRTEFANFIHNLTVFPFAVIRAPVITSKRVGVWDGDSYKIKQEPVWAVKAISPFDCFWSPDSTNPQDGEYFIQRTRMKHSELHNCIGLPGFNEEAIRRVLDSYSHGFSLDVNEDNTRNDLEEKEDSIFSGNTVDVLIMNGLIPGDLLADNGVIVPDIQQHYESEVWVINDVCIRAVLNTHPLLTRPIYGTSFSKIPGTFAGNGVVDLVRDIERMCNASVRAMLRNFAYSAGPIAEAVVERFEAGENIEEIQPFKIYSVKPDYTGQNGEAMRFKIVPNVANQLLEAFAYYMKLADDFSQVPAYVLGNPHVAGAGRTLGGLSMLMGNAAKGIKQVLLNIDRDIIEPMVESYYVLNMAVGDDEDIKADAKVVARGASGLLQRELAQTRTVEILNLLTPYAQAGALDGDSIKILLREILKTTGLPVDDIIPDPNRIAEIQSALGRVGVVNGLDRGTSNPVPLPPQSRPPNIQPGNPVPINLPTGA